MAEPTLQQIFGASATQTSTQLVITKADFLSLTAASDNKAEQLFVALLLQAKSILTTTRQATNPEQSITIEEPGFGADSLVQRNDQTFRQKALTINLQKLDTSTTIDPDDY